MPWIAHMCPDPACKDFDTAVINQVSDLGNSPVQSQQAIKCFKRRPRVSIDVISPRPLFRASVFTSLIAWTLVVKTVAPSESRNIGSPWQLLQSQQKKAQPTVSSLDLFGSICKIEIRCHGIQVPCPRNPAKVLSKRDNIPDLNHFRREICAFNTLSVSSKGYLVPFQAGKQVKRQDGQNIRWFRTVTHGDY